MKRLLIFLAVIGTLCAVWFGGQYLAGVMYFLLNKASPTGITVSTWSSYWSWYSHDPKQGKYLKLAAGAAGYIILFGAILFGAAISRRPSRSLHGDADWASASDVRKSGLLSDKTGILVGQYEGKYLSFSGQQFVMLAAPTRSGKGVGIIIPNLLNYPDSVAVLDIKFENFYLTSRFRELHGHTCFLFAPFEPSGKTHCWNPFDGITKNPYLRTSELMGMARSLWPGKDPKSAFWDDQACNLFLGLALYLMDTPSLPVSFGEILRQSSGKGQAPKDHIAKIIEARATGDDALCDECLDALTRFSASPDNTMGNILSTFTAPLTIFTSPIVDAATSRSDFDLREVRKRRMSIYLGVQPPDLGSARVLINIFYTQLINLNTRALPQEDPSLRYQCLLVMDEFTAAGKIGIIASANSFIAGYNLRLLTILQSIGQLESNEAYGKDDTRTLCANHDLKIVFPPVEQKEAVEVSETLGTFTEKSISTGSSQQRAMLAGGSVSQNISDQRRSLMLPQELRVMPKDKCIVILRETSPILCHKIFYYKDPIFVDRLKEASPSLAALGKNIPSQEQLLDAIFVKREGSSLVPTNDLELFKATREGRQRDLRDGESVEHQKLALSLPLLDDPDNPSDASISNLVTAFMDQVLPGHDLVPEILTEALLGPAPGPDDMESGGIIEPFDPAEPAEISIADSDVIEQASFAHAKDDFPFGDIPPDDYPDDGPGFGPLDEEDQHASA